LKNAETSLTDQKPFIELCTYLCSVDDDIDTGRLLQPGKAVVRHVRDLRADHWAEAGSKIPPNPIAHQIRFESSGFSGQNNSATYAFISKV
jgi:hypothetical protein